MLKLYYNLGEIDFPMLMDLYAEGNEENARQLYPYEDGYSALHRVRCDFEEYLREEFFSVRGAVYAVWDENGRYLSALRLEPFQDGLLLEALETHPEYRRKGYGKRLIIAVQQWLCQKGACKIYSHIHKRNIASSKIHEACGFSKVLDYAVYIDGTVTANSITVLWQTP